MKTSLSRWGKFIFAAVLMISLSAIAFAKSPASTNASIYWEKAQQNYLKALNSDNIGVRHSAAHYLGEYKLKGAVQKLIVLLQTDKIEMSRMAAALALVQIGEKEGINAVKEASIYDGSEKVAKFCEQLLNGQSNQQDLSLK